VDADEGQIGQVINNLPINASRAMPEGGTIHVDASNRSIGRTVACRRQRLDPCLKALSACVKTQSKTR